MSFTSDSRSFSEKSRFHSSNLTPLKVCIKFAPPSLAIYYTVASSAGKKFLHTINLEEELDKRLTPDEIYESLLKREHGYWNSSKIPKIQIIGLIEKLIETTNDKTPLTSKNIEQMLKGTDMPMNKKIGYETMLSIESSNFGEAILVTDINPSNNQNLEKQNKAVDKSKEIDFIIKSDSCFTKNELNEPLNIDLKQSIPNLQNGNLGNGSLPSPLDDKEPQAPMLSKGISQNEINEYKKSDNMDEAMENEDINKICEEMLFSNKIYNNRSQ